MERNVMKGWVPRFPFNSRTTINRATMFKGPSVEFRRTSDNGFRFIEELERIFVVFEGDGDTQRMILNVAKARFAEDKPLPSRFINTFVIAIYPNVLSKDRVKVAIYIYI